MLVDKNEFLSINLGGRIYVKVKLYSNIPFFKTKILDDNFYQTL